MHSPISKGVNSAFGIGFIEGMVEYRNSIQEEPVSEELEEAANVYVYENAKEEWSDCDMHNAFVAGANWQKSKDAKLIFNAKDDGYRLGLATMKQQMMKEAVNGCCISNGKEVGSAIKSPIGMIFIEYNKFNVGDNVKIFVIKEE